MSLHVISPQFILKYKSYLTVNEAVIKHIQVSCHIQVKVLN